MSLRSLMATLAVWQVVLLVAALQAIAGVVIGWSWTRLPL